MEKTLRDYNFDKRRKELEIRNAQLEEKAKNAKEDLRLKVV